MLIPLQAVHPSYRQSYRYTNVYVKYFSYQIFYNKEKLKIAWSLSVEEGYFARSKHSRGSRSKTCQAVPLKRLFWLYFEMVMSFSTKV